MSEADTGSFQGNGFTVSRHATESDHDAHQKCKGESDVEKRRQHGAEKNKDITDRNPFVNDQVHQFHQPAYKQNHGKNQQADQGRRQDFFNDVAVSA